MHGLSTDNTFDDLEWPLTPISRSRHFSTLNISETTRDRIVPSSDGMGTRGTDTLKHRGRPRRFSVSVKPNPGDGTAFCCHCSLSISFQFSEISFFPVPYNSVFCIATV